MPPADVGVVVAKASNVPLQQSLVGRLTAYRSADVRARVPGVLQKRVYEEGTDVREGQVLFAIDPLQLRAALGQTEGALAQAQANYANAKMAADRARQLLPQKYISQSDYDNAIATERTGAASVQAGKAAVDSARINLGYATVRSPISGRAGKQQVTEGALVGQGEATLLTTVDQIDPLYANVAMSYTDLEQVRRLQAGHRGDVDVQLVLPDGSMYARKGKLDFSGDTVDPTTGSISQRAIIPNPDHTLLPGTYITLNVAMATFANAFLIPQAALQRDAQSAYLLVAGQDGKVVRKDVSAEHSQGDNWIVTNGLSGGEQVIVSGLQKAQPGAQVKASPWQPPGAPATQPAAKPQGDDAAKKG
jgi:membrane fusion protein (multidrug efflux system)